jgi:hypothetical protein
MAGKHSKGGQHKENPNKLANTAKRRERIAKGVAARKQSKPQHFTHPDGVSTERGRGERRYAKFGPPKQQEAA